MSRWEHRYLGQERFPDALSAMEVEHFFTLGEEELVAVRRRRTVLNRLALALQISFLKMTGGTLNSVEIIPTGVLEHLGHQLRCAPPRIASIGNERYHIVTYMLLYGQSELPNENSTFQS
jgi:hypothetical protein